jgi:hypothetical protein
LNTATGSEPQPDHLVFVVHGVGDPQPADALTSLVDSYCALTGATPATPRIAAALPDSHEVPGSAAFVRTFPVNRIDTVRAEDGARTRFVEVYWGDLSRVKGSFGGLVLGTIDLVFGLRHVVKAARLEIDNLEQMPGWIRGTAALAGEAASAMLTLIRAPLLALNLFVAIVVALFLMDVAIRLPLEPDEAVARVQALGTILAASGPCAEWLANPFPAVFAAARMPPEAVYCSSGAPGIAIGSVIGVLLGIVLLLMARARGWSIAMAASLIAIAGIGLGLSIWALASSRLTLIYAGFVEDLTGVLSAGAAAAGVLVLAMLVLSFVAWALAALFRHAHERALRRALTVVNVCSALSAALFVLLLMVAWAALSRQIDVPLLAKRIEGALHLFILVWLTFLLIGLAYGAIALWSWLKKDQLAHGHAVHFPRYIIGPLAVTTIVASALAWPLVFLPTLVGVECADPHGLWSVLRICGTLGATSSQATGWILDHAKALDDFVSVAVMASIGAVILLFAARAHFGTALDIVLDVVSHFSLTTPPAQREAAQLKAEKPKEHAIWHAIVKRFCSVLEHTLAGCAAQRVTVLAHSQGTMIALEGLGAITIERKGGYPASPQRARLAPQRRIDLVTLGCPLTHLYQHYFPLQYVVNRADQALLQRWFNIYRVDDFVGRDVTSETGRIEPTNIPVAPRGHVNYWSDRDVLGHLTDVRHRLL